MMRCTDCNRLVKPVVAFDIDGTIGMYHDHFLDFAENYFGRRFHHMYDGRVDLAEWMDITKNEYRKCKLAYRQGGLKRTMPVYPDAKIIPNALSGLRERGAEVWITTTRPYQRLDNVDPDTQEWLRRNGFQYDGLIYDEDKYARLDEIVGGDRVVAVLEDLPECYERAHKLGMNPILMRRTHNSYWTPPDVAYTTAQALVMIEDRVKGWEKASANH